MDKIPSHISKDLKILIVDDGESTRRLIVSSLKEVGFKNVTIAHGVYKALSKLKEANQIDLPFQLIISDLNMPQLDGMDFLKKVRNLSYAHKVPFIFLSSVQDTEKILDAVDLGANDYIYKPFSQSSILNSIIKVFK